MNAREYRHIAIFSLFEEVPDPRVERTRRHSLMDVLVIALLTMICVGEGREYMEEFGLAKESWLKTLLELTNGIPSADTFRRVLSALDPAAFNACFIAWVQELRRPVADSTDHGPENIALLRKVALNQANRMRNQKRGI